MSDPEARMRLDQWLFRARFFKSRTLAGAVCRAGKIRVGGQGVKKASHTVSPGQVLTFPKANIIRVIKVSGLPGRRGPASEAVTFYEDLTPAQNRLKTGLVPSPAKRKPGAGRPTKKQRRETDRLKET